MRTIHRLITILQPMAILRPMAIRQLIPIAALIMITTASCKKQDDYLDKKYIRGSVVPSSLSDYQGILDDYTVMNGTNPNLAVAAADNIYIADKSLATLSVTVRNTYIWAADMFQGAASGEWTNPYAMIEHANIVLDGLAAGA